MSFLTSLIKPTRNFRFLVLHYFSWPRLSCRLLNVLTNRIYALDETTPAIAGFSDDGLLTEAPQGQPSSATPLVNVPADGLCFYHCIRAAKDVASWMRDHDEKVR